MPGESEGSPGEVSGEAGEGKGVVGKKTAEGKERSEKAINLPLSRIKQIIKMDPDVHLVSNESVFLIAKAAEMFIETLAKDSYRHTLVSKKKTIQRRDVDAAVSAADALVFLEGVLET